MSEGKRPWKDQLDGVLSRVSDLGKALESSERERNLLLLDLQSALLVPYPTELPMGQALLLILRSRMKDRDNYALLIRRLIDLTTKKKPASEYPTKEECDEVFQQLHGAVHILQLLPIGISGENGKEVVTKLAAELESTKKKLEGLGDVVSRNRDLASDNLNLQQHNKDLREKVDALQLEIGRHKTETVQLGVETERLRARNKELGGEVGRLKEEARRSFNTARDAVSALDHVSREVKVKLDNVRASLLDVKNPL